MGRIVWDLIIGMTLYIYIYRLLVEVEFKFLKPR